MAANLDQKPFDVKDVGTHHHTEVVDYASDEKVDHESGKRVAVDIDEGLDPDAVKKLTRRIDFRLIPVLASMYAISLIDRTNLAIARAANDNYFNTELDAGGTNDRYSIITLVFFVPYIIFEMPVSLTPNPLTPVANRTTQVRCPPVAWFCRVPVGNSHALHGLCQRECYVSPLTRQNWSTLAALRAVLGVFESALFPGAAYLISCWYPRKEMAVRNVVFYITSAVAGSFAKPLGYCFSLLHQKRGMSGWRWMVGYRSTPLTPVHHLRHPDHSYRIHGSRSYHRLSPQGDIP